MPGLEEVAAEAGARFVARLCDDYRTELLRRGWTPPERQAFFEVLARHAIAYAEAEGEAGGGGWLH